MSARSHCGRCGREGTISDNQLARQAVVGAKGKPMRNVVRFHCPCGHEWKVDRVEAELNGTFLDRLDRTRELAMVPP